MQPQMPYGAPQGPYPPQPGPGNPNAPHQPYPAQPGQAGYPYPNQPPSPYAGGTGIPSMQQQGPQNHMNPGNPATPQYQPPGGYQTQPGRPAPLPPPPPMHKTPYDFFMQQKHPMNTKGMLPRPKQLGMREKLIGVAGAAIVIMLIVVIINALAPKDTSVQGLATLAQTQQEIARVCGQGFNKAKIASTRYYAVNCTTSILSDQAKLLTYLNTQKAGLKPKQLGTLTNLNTDKALTAAAAASSYDETFKTTITKQLDAYAGLIQQQLASGELGTNAQALLNEELAHVKILTGN